MSNIKISQLTAVSTPDGTELVPVVQSGATRKATVNQIQTAPIAAGTANGLMYLDASKQPTSSSAATFDGSNLSVPSYNGGQLAGMRNKIINGKMEIAQRGTSFAAIATDTYSLDRYLWANASSAVVTISQQSDAPSDNEFQNSLRIAVTTADTSIAAGDFATIRQRIEGYNARDLIGKTFTLSFWVRSSKTGTHCVAFFNNVHDRTYVAEYTISAANTWEYKSVTVTGGLITAGTWNWTNGAGLQVMWSLAAGTTFQTTAGAWQTGSFIATSNQVNCLDSTSNIFAITGVQLEVGGVATPFEHRLYGSELALCQRYYRRSEISLGVAITTTQADYVFIHSPEMRATPTASQLATGLNLRVNGTTTNIGTTSNFITNGSKSSNVQLTRSTGTWTAGNVVVLSEQSAFDFSSEL